MTTRFTHLLARRVLVVAGLLMAPGCRETDDLVDSISATIIVVGIDEEELVQVDIEGLRLRAQPEVGDNLVSFGVSLPIGTFQGQVTIFEVESEDDGVELRPRDCGPFSVTIVDSGDPVAVAIVADDLPDCEGEDVEDPVEATEAPLEDPVEDPVDDSGEGEGEDPEP